MERIKLFSTVWANATVIARGIQYVRGKIISITDEQKDGAFIRIIEVELEHPAGDGLATADAAYLRGIVDAAVWANHAACSAILDETGHANRERLAGAFAEENDLSKWSTRWRRSDRKKLGAPLGNRRATQTNRRSGSE